MASNYAAPRLLSHSHFTQADGIKEDHLSLETIFSTWRSKMQQVLPEDVALHGISTTAKIEDLRKQLKNHRTYLANLRTMTQQCRERFAERT